jgi:hypothetical protein
MGGQAVIMLRMEIREWKPTEPVPAGAQSESSISSDSDTDTGLELLIDIKLGLLFLLSELSFDTGSTYLEFIEQKCKETRDNSRHGGSGLTFAAWTSIFQAIAGELTDSASSMRARFGVKPRKTPENRKQTDTINAAGRHNTVMRLVQASPGAAFAASCSLPAEWMVMADLDTDDVQALVVVNDLYHQIGMHMLNCVAANHKEVQSL